MKKSSDVIFKILMIAAAVFITSATGTFQTLQAKTDPISELPERYRQWWDDVCYIITKTEKEVFLKLQTDRERDIFINSFWNHRDPNRNTPENEFKDEHYRRKKYVEDTYGRAKFDKAGWKTDRGKVYIILGQPQAIQKFTSLTKVYPLEVWHYQVEPKGGLPPAFNLIFWEKDNGGDYVLYSPYSDGPQKLLIGYQGSQSETIEAYQQLHDFNSFLADTAISLIPGEQADVGVPSMSSDFLLRNIEEFPKKEVEDIYAKKFLQYKGIVDVEYSANYISSKNMSQIFKDESGNSYISYLIQYNKLTVNKYNDFYYANLDVYGNLTDTAGNVVYQYQKTFNLKFSETEFQTVQDSSFALSDQLPVIPGNYKLTILVKNTISKELVVYETNIAVPQPSGKLSITNPLLAYEIKPRTQQIAPGTPFTTSNNQLFVDPDNKFSRKDNLNIFFQVYGLTDDIKNTGKIKLTFRGENGYSKDMLKNLSEIDQKDNSMTVIVPLTDFPTDYFSVTVSLIDKQNNSLVSQDNRFYITPLSIVSRPKTMSKTSSVNRDALSCYILGTQYMNLKKPTLALPFFEKARNLAPQIKDFSLSLARLYFDTKQYDKVIPILTPFMDEAQPDFQLYFLLGSTYQRTEKYPDAIKCYKSLIVHHGLNVDVLNALASCFFNNGEKEEAKKAWEQSLKVEPNQEKVKEAIRGLNNETSKSKK